MIPPNTAPQPVLSDGGRWPLHSIAATRGLEHAGLAATPPHALMQRAGLASARLAQALAAPGATVWVAAGPGNNGGDGLVAARFLHQWGRRVEVCWLGTPAALPEDARDALGQAQAAGVRITPALPSEAPSGLAIDALLGIGAARAPSGALASAIDWLNRGSAEVLAIDVPTGLSADTGRVLGDAAVRAAHTLSLLTLKPGLFTADGREHAGQVWWHGLGLAGATAPPQAWLSAKPAWPPRGHGQHKGSFGDVAVFGGAAGMGGAALLAARAALACGAGRVFIARLDPAEALAVDPQRPELMPRRPESLLSPAVLGAATVVCGCGGGTAVAECLPAVLADAARLVLDADALNAIAGSTALQAALVDRASRQRPTLLTPHPLEAARLLGTTTAAIQADRLAHAQALAERYQCTAVLKGSGSVVAAPGATPSLNPSGNARLGTAGSGDVLAGWLGGTWSQQAAADLSALAAAVVWLHGAAAECGDPRLPLRANDLIEAMAATLGR